MDIQVTKRYIDSLTSNGSIGGSSSIIVANTPTTPSTNTTKEVTVTPVIVYPKIIQFVNTKTPQIINYDSLYADTYGTYPTIRLFTYISAESTSMIEQKIAPTWHYGDKGLSAITWDLGEIMSGFIVITL